MPKVHDRGGWPTDEPIDMNDHEVMDWEVRANAIRQVLGQKGLMRSDELRRGIENIEPNKYETLGYFERWAESMESLMVEKGILTREEIDQKMSDFASESR